MQASEYWTSLAVPLGVLAGTLAAGYFGKRPLFRLLRRKSAVTKPGIVRIAIKVLHERYAFWVLMLALELAAQVSRLPARPAWQIARLLVGLWILSLMVTGLRFAARLVQNLCCAFGHHWSWPRRRAGIDTQVCCACGFERRSPIQFGAGSTARFGDKHPITA